MALLTELTAVCGADRVRPGGPAGSGAGFVVTPGDPAQVGGVIEVAASHGLAITPTGAGNITIDVAGSVAIDTAGNNNSAATQAVTIYDATAPTVESPAA